MFNAKTLLVAGFACLSLFAVAAPNAHARPGPVNPFSHPVQAYAWNADQAAGTAKRMIADVSARSAFAMLNPGHNVVPVDERNPAAVAAWANSQIDGISASYTNIINGEALMLSTELAGTPAESLLSAVESARAAGVESIGVASSTGKTEVSTALTKCGGGKAKKVKASKSNASSASSASTSQSRTVGAGTTNTIANPQ